MPIYEYQAEKPSTGCRRCRIPFEVYQNLNDPPLVVCPECGNRVRKLISWCRAAVAAPPDEVARTEGRIRDYEKSGMWSHAAELADKQAESSGDRNLKTRALENYEKAGWDAGTLSRHDSGED
jgi:putative FmdB family regulatory protein